MEDSWKALKDEKDERDEKLDTQYLRNLSLDSVPEVVNLLDDKIVSKDIEKYLAERQEDLALQRSWQSFNLSRHKAKQVLTQSKL
jgi:hypothetical protein